MRTFDRVSSPFHLLFNSLTFLAFFCAVLVAMRLPLRWESKKAVLAVFSWTFYAAADPPLVLLLLGSTLFNWLLGLQIDRSESDRRRHWLMVVGVVANLAVLVTFKYSGFLIRNFQAAAEAVGWNVRLAAPDLPLPIGVSFFTFQAIAYIVEIRRRKLAACSSLLDFAVFASYFPHLVAGPIVRADGFLPQLRTEPKPNAAAFERGAFLVALGLFQKVVLADAVLAPVADKVFAPGGRPDFVAAWTGALAFSGQIFCDFAGYTTAAIGVAAMVGLHLNENFRRPYAAATFSDFWRRWHISLSTWLRDYLYKPLGGDRRGSVRTSVNLMLVMLIGGLWHGAAWTFVVWGGLHGAFLLLERASGFREAPRNRALRFLRALFTLGSVTVAWVFFRAADFTTAASILQGMAGGHAGRGSLALDGGNVVAVFVAFGAIVAAHHLAPDTDLGAVVERTPRPLLVLLLSGVFISFVLLARPDRAFIYFQF